MSGMKVVVINNRPITNGSDFIGRPGTITLDMTNLKLAVHDGIVPGGRPIGSEDTELPQAVQDLQNSLDALSALVTSANADARLDNVEQRVVELETNPQSGLPEVTPDIVRNSLLQLKEQPDGTLVPKWIPAPTVIASAEEPASSGDPASGS